MEEELISIVVPIYKVEKYLSKCVDSIIKQTYKNIEIILVDDGSPDKCPEICDEYAGDDERIKVIHKKNGGLSDARNAGIEIAKGKYIAFIDSDDYIKEDFIEVLLNGLVKEQADISMCGIKKVNETNEVIERIKMPSESVITGEDAIEQLGEFPISNIVVWNKLYRIDLFKDIRYPKGKIHEDEFTTYKLLYESKKIAINKECLYYYRQNNDSIMNKKFNSKRLDIIEALEERIEFFMKRNNERLYKATLVRYIETIIYIYDLGQKELKRQDKKGLIRKYKQTYKVLKKNKYSIGNGKKGKYLFLLCPYIYICWQRLKEKFRKIRDERYRRIEIKKYQRYKTKCKNNKKREFLIFNSPIHGNIGDHAIYYAEEKLLKEMGIIPFEVPTFREKYFFDYIKGNLSDDAIISITGGGFIGSEWLEEQNLVNKVLKEFKEHKIIIFPCTIYFKQDEQGKEELIKFKENVKDVKDLYIFARETKTFEFVKKELETVKTYLSPDIVLSLQNMDINEDRSGILVCLRKDVETTFTNEKKERIINAINKLNEDIKYTDTVINQTIEGKDRERIFKDKLEEFSKSRLVITDRLHGMVFAYLTNTPCIVFSNYNYKVEGVYNWIKYKTESIIYETDINNIENDIEKLYNRKGIKNKDHKKLDFDELKELIKS